ncbi:MAG: Gfo/Idh/MocA family oxidoreductase [Erysipelotrichaceae bacterium]|nr:Gfo/Idh/MocA family oxidoreductase [Erysipelotrichaceae bacterium]
MLKVAYIGFGNSVKRYHLPYVEKRKEKIEVKYIYRRKEDIELEGTEAESWYPNIIFTSEIQDIMKDEEVNLVVINTPDQFHTFYSKMALENGKNILVEKPFALSLADAKEVFDLAKEKGLVAMANHNRRFDADMKTLRSVIESKVLGDLVEIESHYDYFRPSSAARKGFGALKGLAIHPLDQIISLFGKPKKVVYDCRSIDYPGEADNYYDFDLFYDNGLKAIVKTSFYVKLDYPRFILHGKKGSFLMPSLGHQSSLKEKPGPVEISFEPISEEYWGTLSYIDEENNDITKKIETQIGDYGVIYDNLYDVIFNGANKIVSEEDVYTGLEIVFTAEKIAREAK